MFRRYEIVIGEYQVLDRQHVSGRVNVSVFLIAAFALECPVGQAEAVMLFAAMWTPLGRRYPLVEDYCLRQDF